jgi:hypothetical protein
MSVARAIFLKGDWRTGLPLGGCGWASFGPRLHSSKGLDIFID